MVAGGMRTKQRGNAHISMHISPPPCRPLNQRRNGVQLTVDSNSNSLAQDVTVSALEGRDLAKLVELLVVFADALGRLGVHKLEVDVVGLGDCEDGSGARVVL